MVIDRADLHAHTTVSDGTRTPAEVIRLAAEKGLAAVAITDHDTMGGVEEALEEGAKLGITVVPGIEISTSASGKDIHILGYYADWRDAKWKQRLELLRTGRGRRNEQIVEALQQHGISITMDEVVTAAGQLEGRKSIGRPHIAAVLVEKGIVSTISEAFEQWIGSGKPGYVNLAKVSPFEAVEWIAKPAERVSLPIRVYMAMMNWWRILSVTGWTALRFVIQTIQQRMSRVIRLWQGATACWRPQARTITANDRVLYFMGIWAAIPSM